MTEPTVGSRVFAQIARELASQPDAPDTMARLVEIARELLGCDQVAVWELSNGRAALRASTDAHFGATLARIVIDVEQGPIRTTLRDNATQLVRDLDRETRWPRYADEIRAARLPVRSVLAFSLDLCSKHFGALVFYSAQPDYFTPELVDLAAVVADHATLALNTARAEEKAEHLQQALESNRRIGIAIGILVALHKINDDQAFDMLRAASQHNHTKLRDVAEEVIFSGEVPQWPTRRPAA